MSSQRAESGVVLWIDDEPSTVSAARDAARTKGYVVETAESCLEAALFLRERGDTVRLVVQDIMRVGSGNGVTEEGEDPAGYSAQRLAGLHFYDKLLREEAGRRPCVFYSVDVPSIIGPEWAAHETDAFVVQKRQDPAELLTVIEVCLGDSQDIAWQQFEIPTIIVPHADAISDELIRHITMHPELMYEMRPRLFEELVAHLLQEQGYEAELTRQTRDGGIDIIATHHDLVGETVWVVECKRWGPKNHVGIGVVQRLHGVRDSIGANAAMVATTSFFSKDARNFQRSVGCQLQLKDFDDMCGLLSADQSRGT